jgi:phage terminase small subunit
MELGVLEVEKMAKLTAKQERFCQEYVIDNNGTQASIRAGYSKKTACSIGEQNLRKIEIQAKISDLRAAINDKLALEADFVISKLMSIADFNISKIANYDGKSFAFKPMGEWPAGSINAIASFKETTITRGTATTTVIDIKFESKLTALEALGRHLGMFQGFDQAVATLATYGINLKRGEDGSYSIDGE